MLDFIWALVHIEPLKFNEHISAGNGKEFVLIIWSNSIYSVYYLYHYQLQKYLFENLYFSYLVLLGLMLVVVKKSELV